MSLFLIILAAGNSKRLKSNIPKPFQTVNNKTLLEHSLGAFKNFNEIKKTVIVYNKKHKKYLNKLNLKNATSSEFDKKGLPIIGLINEWSKDGKTIKGTDKNLGGTMRLGSYDAKLKKNSMIQKIYGKNLIKERHRHRYEVNIAFKEKFEKNGMSFSGLSPDGKLPEIIELKNHPWFIGVQFHPEFKSRPLNPHPLFSSFIKAEKNHR